MSSFNQCSGKTTIAGFGVVPCSLAPHDDKSYHRWQAERDGVAVAVMWTDNRRRIGFAEINSLQTLLSGVQPLDPEATGLAIAGWLLDRPAVAEAIARQLGWRKP